MTKPFLVLISRCKRCGRAIGTGSRSLYGADAAKAELGEICQRCVTPEEERRILAEQASAIRENHVR